MNIKKIILSIFVIILTSCNSNIVSSITTSSSSNINSSSYSSTENNYEKDDNGFYILEDDYFKNTAVEDDKKINKLVFSKNIDEEYIYPNMRLFALGENIPIVNVKTNISHSWTKEASSRVNNGAVSLEIEGKIEFIIQCNFRINGRLTINPTDAEIPYSIDENRRTVKFEISSKGQYTIEFINHKTLHLFVNSYHEYEEYKNKDNLIYFPSGIHNSSNSKYISNDNFIHLKSNQIVFIDVGAIVQAGFTGYQLNNVQIVGSGIIDNSMYERNVDTGKKLIPFDFSYCQNLKFKGITNLDPAGWCYNIYFCDNIEIDNVKIISSRSNGDGISIQSSKNVICTNSFVRTWDDSLVVKNYPRWDNGSEGSTYNVHFKKIIVWTDLAQCLEIGYETYGKRMEDISFEDIIIIHAYHNAPISIHNGNNAEIKNIKFKNILIEDASMGQGNGKNYLIDFSTEFSSTWSNGHGTTSLGSINSVEVNNIYLKKVNNSPTISIMGTIDTRPEYNNSTHYISNIDLIDIKIKDQILNKNYSKYYKNDYTKNINFITTGQEINGTTFIKDYLSTIDKSIYGTNALVEIK